MSVDSLAALDEAVRRFEPLWRTNYDPQVSRDFNPGPETIKQRILANLERLGEEPLIYFRDLVVTRREADLHACAVANALIDLGIRKGERVSLIMANRPEIVYGFMACYKAGYVAAAYNQRCTSLEISSSVNTVGSSVVFIEGAHLEKIAVPVREGRCPTVRAIVVLDEYDASLDAGVPVLPYEDFVAGASTAEPDVEVTPDDPAIVLFTGGTTGVSKGVCATQGKVTHELRIMHHWAAPALAANPDPRVLICMPMTHIMGINYGVHWQLINGGSTVVAEGAHAEEIISSFIKYEPTMWAALPTLLHTASLDERLGQTPYKDLDLIIFGGSFIAMETMHRLTSQTRAKFAESYGMSESFGFVTANPVMSQGKLGSVGLPISTTDLLIVDLEEGVKPLEPGERGEIIFRGPQVATEYLNNPEETAKAIRGGWMYSGDIGYMDEDGFFYVVDRKKDMIEVSGFNVFPKEIDELLMTHPCIADACTIGVPNEHSCERPKSFVVLRPGCDLTEAEVIAFCKKSLVAYKAPKFVEFVDEIPKTRNRKQDRAILRKRELEKLAANR